MHTKLAVDCSLDLSIQGVYWLHAECSAVLHDCVYI